MRDLRHTSTSIGVAQNVTVNAQPNVFVPPSLGVDGWKALLAETAPNALHDSKARYDPPKCDEDTRVEVIGEITNWIEDRESPQRLLCMTGAAGAGKSALQQTIAEYCSESNILGSTYFFSASDPTRNTTPSLIPTIASQLGRANPGLKEHIGLAVEEDPHIFSKTLRCQMAAIIRDPVRRLRRAGKLDLASFRYVILIDGIDECRGEDNQGEARQDGDCQTEILMAVKECLLDDDLPFRIFIASRPECAIHDALESGGELHELAYHIQLSDYYDATADIRRYLRRRLQGLGLRSRDPRARSGGWFSEKDIEKLVIAASGQFVFAATVVRYLSERRSSPVDRLKIVLTWTPARNRSARPFEKLDLLYYSILSAAKMAYEAIDTHSEDDFLLLFRAYQINATHGFNDINSGPTLSLPNKELNAFLQVADDILISDLRSLVTTRPHPGGPMLHLYHKTFADFLNTESRSRDLFVPSARVQSYLAKCYLQHVLRCPELRA
ncbi:hypothetical protein EST38_g2097 [Candolleomyces aberdarensis]|uniref:Nephrocystin 3-like N-terminal domain-containing protein n=1 Tax=Candolleomyces aberdarensis TaxID=2316362 RepID=A0A4Q2DXN0_9AGAR|nr:hypothetical protein EST38_g2097 [Candolleomyces aberdarensis]